MKIQSFLRNIKPPRAVNTTIKTKIIALITVLGVTLSLLLALYSPNQAQKLGRDILKNDAIFISNLLAENLALGMQTLEIDEGSAITQTLSGLKTKKEEKWETISDIYVYDKNGIFLTGLYKTKSNSMTVAVNELTIHESGQSIESVSPLRDMDNNILGYVKIVFSKKYLNQKVTRTSLSTAIISVLVLTLTLLLGFLISREAAGGIQNAVNVMQVIARGEGDLTKRIEIHSKDEVGQLQNWINHFMEKIHDLIVQVKWNTDLVSHAANAISITSSQMANGAEKQSEHAIEAATTVERITTSIVQNAHHAAETTKMAEEATLIARDGNEAMQAVLDGMNGIVESTKESGKLIYSLSRQTNRIGEVVHIIDDIAVQTNLLAINASIEATRAGDQGKGFMVIANEIHRLSDQTIQSTQLIAETIKSIQTDIKKASESMRGTEEMVSKGQNSTKQTEEVLNRVIHTIRTAMEMMKNIASSFADQSANAREISSCVDDISQITKQASSGSIAVALASKEMKLQTDALHDSVSHFKLKNSNDRQQNKDKE